MKQNKTSLFSSFLVENLGLRNGSFVEIGEVISIESEERARWLTFEPEGGDWDDARIFPVEDYYMVVDYFDHIADGHYDDWTLTVHFARKMVDLPNGKQREVKVDVLTLTEDGWFENGLKTKAAEKRAFDHDVINHIMAGGIVAVAIPPFKALGPLAETWNTLHAGVGNVWKASRKNIKSSIEGSAAFNAAKEMVKSGEAEGGEALVRQPKAMLIDGEEMLPGTKYMVANKEGLVVIKQGVWNGSDSMRKNFAHFKKDGYVITRL